MKGLRLLIDRLFDLLPLVPTDLIYEGITTQLLLVSFFHLLVVPTDLIYEGITTRQSSI